LTTGKVQKQNLPQNQQRHWYILNAYLLSLKQFARR